MCPCAHLHAGRPASSCPLRILSPFFQMANLAASSPGALVSSGQGWAPVAWLTGAPPSEPGHRLLPPRCPSNSSLGHDTFSVTPGSGPSPLLFAWDPCCLPVGRLRQDFNLFFNSVFESASHLDGPKFIMTQKDMHCKAVSHF